MYHLAVTFILGGWIVCLWLRTTYGTFSLMLSTSVSFHGYKSLSVLSAFVGPVGSLGNPMSFVIRSRGSQAMIWVFSSPKCMLSIQKKGCFSWSLIGPVWPKYGFAAKDLWIGSIIRHMNWHKPFNLNKYVILILAPVSSIKHSIIMYGLLCNCMV